MFWAEAASSWLGRLSCVLAELGWAKQLASLARATPIERGPNLCGQIFDSGAV